MKRCPECRRDYTDDSLLYCLEDGIALVQGSVLPPDEPQTAILHETTPPSEAGTRAEIHMTDQSAVYPAATEGGITTRSRALDKRLLIVPFVLAIIVLASFFGYRYFYAGDTAINSIAVLPFENRSGNADTDYLSDGLAESLIYRLSQLPNLKVSPTSSVMRYKGNAGNLQAIAAELGVQAVLTGRVGQRGDNLSISVEMIDTANSKVLWGEQYEKKMSDLLATQREIATVVVDKLQLKLAGNETTGITKKYTNSSEAYQLYLKGRFQWNKRTAEGLKAAETSYKQAIEIDPSFALAYSGLAETYVLFSNYSVSSPKDSAPKAKAAAMKAIELDGSLAEPHAALGGYHNFYTWDLEAVERELGRAIELNPKYATAHHWLGITLPALGKCDQAIAVAKRAEELDPLSAIISADLGFVLTLCRRYDEAIAQLEKALRLDPNFYYAHYNLGFAKALKGDHRAGVVSIRKSIELNADPFAKALFVFVLAKAGERPEAAKVRDELRAESKRRFIDPYFLAIAEASLGDNDAAIMLLEQTLVERGVYTPFIAVDPAIDDLRTDSRFPAMVKKIQSSKLE